MASKHKTYLKDTVVNASDLIYDFSCSLCKEDTLNTEAKYFCGDCSKYYCDKCLTFHAKVHKDHVVLGRKDVDKWVGQGEALVKCDLHPQTVMELLCEDHDELCCQICVTLNHRSCRSTRLISDLARGIHKMAVFKQLPANVTMVTTNLTQVRDARQKNQNSLKASGKSMLTKVKALRTSLNQLLDELEKRTVKEMNSVLADLDGPLQKDINACTHIHNQLKALLDTIQAQDEDSESTSYIGYRKCQDKMTEANMLLQEISTKPEVTVNFQLDTHAEQFLSDLKTLGNILVYPGNQGQPYQSGMPTTRPVNQIFDKSKVFKLIGNKSFPAKLKTDKENCIIAGITELPGGEIVLVDNTNCKAKVLDSKFKVIAHCDLPQLPQDICHISGQEVAVTVDCRGGNVTQKVLFLTVSADTIKMTRMFTVDHDCFSISHHGGQLYVGSLTALYLYTTAGRLVKKIHEDTSKDTTVNQFAFSTDGRKIFNPASDHNLLVTMDNQGNILATLQDPDFNWPCCVHVSESGHVFVCSYDSHTVVQVDQEGRKKLATLVRKGDGINHP
ncbi:TRI33-like protein, partial [Mya arenaria]